MHKTIDLSLPFALFSELLRTDLPEPEGRNRPEPDSNKDFSGTMRDAIKRAYSEASPVDGVEIPDGDPSGYEIRASNHVPGFPKIKRVVFNDPVTKVWFEDGTTSSVRVSKDDVFSKEAGLAFAIVKRLCGTPDERGNYGSGGYMMELKRIVERAYDQTPLTRKMHAERDARRKARAAMAPKGTPPGKKPPRNPTRKKRA